MKSWILVLFLGVVAILSTSEFSTVAAQTIVGGYCQKHDYRWRGSSDCPMCIRERNMPRNVPPPPPPREPSEEELQAKREAMRRAAELIQEIEDERERKKAEKRQQLDSDVQSALRSLKDVNPDGTYTPGLKDDDDFKFRPSQTPGGPKTLFEKGNKDSAPVDTRAKGASRLDVPEVRLAPKDHSLLFPKAGDPSVQAPDPKDVEYLFPKDFGLQTPAADDLRFLFPEELDPGRKWPGPVNRGSRLYNPLREPDRASLDFELDSAIVKRGEKKDEKAPGQETLPKFDRARRFLAAQLDWSDFRKEVFASIPNLPLKRSPQLMAALQERCKARYQEHGEAYGRLLFATINEMKAEYQGLADQKKMSLDEFIHKAQEDTATAKTRDEAWAKVDDRRTRRLEGIIVKFEVDLEADILQLLAAPEKKK